MDKLSKVLTIKVQTVNDISLVDNDTIVVDLTHLVKMSQVVETDFVIMRDEEILYFATYTIVNVSQPSIIVNEHYVVIEYE